MFGYTFGGINVGGSGVIFAATKSSFTDRGDFPGPVVNASLERAPSLVDNDHVLVPVVVPTPSQKAVKRQSKGSQNGVKMESKGNQKSVKMESKGSRKAVKSQSKGKSKGSQKAVKRQSKRKEGQRIQRLLNVQGTVNANRGLVRDRNQRGYVLKSKG